MKYLFYSIYFIILKYISQIFYFKQNKYKKINLKLWSSQVELNRHPNNETEG